MITVSPKQIGRPLNPWILTGHDRFADNSINIDESSQLLIKINCLARSRANEDWTGVDLKNNYPRWVCYRCR